MTNASRTGGDGTAASSTPRAFDWACTVHLHSTYSDGTPTMPELLGDAAANGRDALLITDHDTLAARADGWERRHGSVLAVVGTEISTRDGHLLAFGIDSSPDLRDRPGGEAIAAVARQGGICFAAHPFSAGSSISKTIGKPHPWRALADPDLTGVEVWSLITDAAESWRSPAEALRFIRSPKRATRRPDRSRLRRWDELGSERRLVGIGGLDAHQSGLRLLGRWVLSPFPNRRLFGSLATHVLTDEPPSDDPAADRRRLLAALASGRCYLAMDWHRSARGFDFWATSEDRVAPMGSELEGDGWRLRATLPASARLVLLRDGTPIYSCGGADALAIEIRQPGVYRLEAWLTDEGDDACWIISNPIYLREPGRRQPSQQGQRERQRRAEHQHQVERAGP